MPLEGELAVVGENLGGQPQASSRGGETHRPNQAPRSIAFNIGALLHRIPDEDIPGIQVREAEARIQATREQGLGRLGGKLLPSIPVLSEVAEVNKRRALQWLAAGHIDRALPPGFTDKVKQISERLLAIDHEQPSTAKRLLSEVAGTPSALEEKVTEVFGMLSQAVGMTPSEIAQNDTLQGLVDLGLVDEYRKALSDSFTSEQAIVERLSDGLEHYALRRAIGEKKAGAPVELTGPIHDFFAGQLDKLLLEGVTTGTISDQTRLKAYQDTKDWLSGPNGITWRASLPDEQRNALDQSLLTSSDFLLIVDKLLPEVAEQVKLARDHGDGISDLDAYIKGYVQNVAFRVNVGTVKAGEHELIPERASTRQIRESEVARRYAQAEGGSMPDETVELGAARAELIRKIWHRVPGKILITSAISPIAAVGAVFGSAALHSRRIGTQIERDIAQHAIETSRAEAVYEGRVRAGLEELMLPRIGIQETIDKFDAVLTRLRVTDDGRLSPEDLPGLLAPFIETNVRNHLESTQDIDLWRPEPGQLLDERRTHLAKLHKDAYEALLNYCLRHPDQLDELFNAYRVLIPEGAQRAITVAEEAQFRTIGRTIPPVITADTPIPTGAPERSNVITPRMIESKMDILLNSISGLVEDDLLVGERLMIGWAQALQIEAHERPITAIEEDRDRAKRIAQVRSGLGAAASALATGVPTSVLGLLPAIPLELFYSPPERAVPIGEAQATGSSSTNPDQSPGAPIAFSTRFNAAAEVVVPEPARDIVPVEIPEVNLLDLKLPTVAASILTAANRLPEPEPQVTAETQAQAPAPIEINADTVDAEVTRISKATGFSEEKLRLLMSRAPQVPAAPEPPVEPQRPNLTISPSQPGILEVNYTLPTEGRLHGDVAQIGMNQAGEFVMTFGDGQATLLENRFNPYDPQRRETRGDIFSIREISQVDGVDMVHIVARHNRISRTHRSFPLEQLLSELNSGRVIIPEAEPLHVGRLPELQIRSNEPPITQLIPGLLPIIYQLPLEGRITDRITGIGIDEQGELVIRYPGLTRLRHRPRGNTLGTTFWYRDPNAEGRPVRLTVTSVANNNSVPTISFRDNNNQPLSVPVGEFLNSINADREFNTWRLDWSPRRTTEEVLAPELAPQPAVAEATTEASERPEAFAARTFMRRVLFRPLTPTELTNATQATNWEGLLRPVFEDLSPEPITRDEIRDTFIFVCEQFESHYSTEELGRIFDENRMVPVIQPLLEERPNGWTPEQVFAYIQDEPDPANQDFFVRPVPNNVPTIDNELFERYTHSAQGRPFLIANYNPDSEISAMANPQSAPYAYTPASRNDPNPQDTRDGRFRSGEGATDGDSGVLALAAAGAETPQDQARLYTNLATTIINIHLHGRNNNNNVLATWMIAQDRMSAPTSLDAFRQFDHERGLQPPHWQNLRNENERLVELDDFEGTWTNRLNELQAIFAQNPISLQPHHIRWIEFLSHSVDVAQIVRDMQANTTV